MYDRILFPTDRGPASDRVLEHALALADQFDAVLYGLYVVDTGGMYRDVDEAGTEWGPLIQAVRRDGDAAIGEIERRAEERDVAFVGEVRENGAVYRAVLDCADENDLIVMGTHGRRGLDRWLLGSVAERVVRSADIPTLTVRTATPSE